MHGRHGLGLTRSRVLERVIAANQAKSLDSSSVRAVRGALFRTATAAFCGVTRSTAGGRVAAADEAEWIQVRRGGVEVKKRWVEGWSEDRAGQGNRDTWRNESPKALKNVRVNLCEESIS